MLNESPFSGGEVHADQIEFLPTWMQHVVDVIAGAKRYPGRMAIEDALRVLGSLEWERSDAGVDVLVGNNTLFVRLRVHLRELEILIPWLGRNPARGCIRCMLRESGKVVPATLLHNPTVDQLRVGLQWVDPQFMSLIEIDAEK